MLPLGPCAGGLLVERDGGDHQRHAERVIDRRQLGKDEQADDRGGARLAVQHINANVARCSRAMAGWSVTYGTTEEQTP